MLTERRAALAQALGAGVLFGLDHIVGLVTARGGYTPFTAGLTVSPDTWDATAWYAGGARRFMESGSFVSGDLAGSGGFDNFQSPLSNAIAGGLAWITGSLEDTWMVLQGLLPAIAWLLVYRLGRRHTDSRSLASLLAWATLLVPFGVREIFLVDSRALDRPLELARMYQPAFSFPLIVACVLAVSAASRRADRLSWLGAGVLTGALAYVYYFAWVAALGGVLLLFVLAPGVRRRLALVAACAVAVDVPYFVLTAFADPKGAGRPLLGREGGSFTHHVSASHVALFVVLIGVLAAAPLLTRARGRGLDPALVLLAVVTAAAGGLSLQLVTGYDPLGQHFVLRVLKPTGFLLVGLVLIRAASSVNVPRRALAAGAIAAAAALVGLGAARQYESSTRALAAFRTGNARTELLTWLRRHTPAGAVVATTDARLIAEIPAGSGNRLFVPGGLRTHATNDEILLRYLLAARLEGQSLATVENALRDRPLAPGEDVWRNPSWVLFVSDHGYRGDLPAAAGTRWRTLAPRRELASRRLDYLVAGSGVPRGLPRFYPDVQVVYSNRAWTVLRTFRPRK